jgi:hypothetical protein
MSKMKRIAAAVMLVLTLGVIAAPAASAAPNCSPGQHGNPQPGFKPAPCPPN